MTIQLDSLLDVETPDFKRDRWGRPSIMQPNGNRKGYTRCSSAAKTIEDTFNLEKWARRNVAYGMAYDASLVARILAIGGDPASWGKTEKDAVNAIVEDAEQVAKAHRAADIGTAVHRLTERLDRGETVDGGPYQADLDAYRQAMTATGFVVVEVECRMVNDELEMAGTADRIIQRPDGTCAIADIKTSASVDFGGLGWAAQLAAYAGGHLYNCDTEQRIDTPDIDKQVGYIIHLPAGQGRCDLYQVDIAAGLEAARLANQIRAVRKAAKDWITACEMPQFDKAGLMGRWKRLAAADPVFEEKWAELGIPKGDLAAVDAALRVFERPKPLSEMVARVRSADPPKPEPVVDDEGGPADEADINTCKTRFELGMTAGQKAWIGAVVKEAIAGNVDFRVTVKATRRRADIYSGLTKFVCSDYWDDDTDKFEPLVRAIVPGNQPDIPLGQLLGGLSTVNSARFRELVDQVLADTQILLPDPATGRWQLKPAA